MVAKSPNRANAYLVKEILEASPQKLLLKIYDYAIVNCQKGDMIKTNNAIGELIYSLDFNDDKGKDISQQLLRLYQYAQEEMRRGERDNVLSILTNLRNTWVQVFENQKN
ncbi:MAG: flagellar protein FliS [Melioribacteraceae bacterium]|nr:flagellar protein FliS [Melioribacteraceae bacterium]